MSNNNSTLSPHNYNADLTIVDAKDGGLISRPRTWWQNIRWDVASHLVHQHTPWQIVQTFHQTTWHLHNPIAALLQPQFHMKDWETPTVLQDGQPFHCLTTQEPTDQGRPPPESTQVEHQRQFAPWQYQPQYLTRYQDGPWQPITPLQRERLMGFHPTATPAHLRSIQEHHAGQHLAGANSHVDAIPPAQLRSRGYYPSRSQIYQHPEDDSRVEQLPGTMGTSTTDSRTPLHATNGLDSPFVIGPNNNISTVNTHPHWIQPSIGQYITRRRYTQYRRGSSQHLR